MNDEGDFNDEILTKKRQENIMKNPHITTWFFNRRFENFFNDLLKLCWDLEDW